MNNVLTISAPIRSVMSPWSASLKLRTWLFLSFTALTTIPVGLLIAWVYQNAVNNEYLAVKEKHLIVAQNLSESLSRYATDAKLTFDVLSENFDVLKTKKSYTAMANEVGLQYIAEIEHTGRVSRSMSFVENVDVQPSIPNILIRKMRLAPASQGTSFSGV